MKLKRCLKLKRKNKPNLFLSGLKCNPSPSTFNPSSSSLQDQGQQHLALLLLLTHRFFVIFTRLIRIQCFFSHVSDQSHHPILTQFSKLLPLGCGTACWVASQLICSYSLVPEALEPSWRHLVGTSGYLLRKPILPPCFTEAIGVGRPWPHSQVIPELASDPLCVLSLSREVLVSL